MKKLLLTLLLLPFGLCAQMSMKKYYQLQMVNYDIETYFNDQSLSRTTLKKNGIKEVVTQSTTSKGKQNKTQMNYNREGKLLYSQNKGRTVENIYEHDTLLTASFTKTSKGKVFESKSSYIKGKLELKEIFKNGKLQSTTSLRYNAQDNVTNSQMVKGNKVYEIQYLYNDEFKMTKSTYLVNGKVKKEWVYECKPEGQVIASKTEELSSLCTYREESSDGSYSTFTRSLRDGKPYLFKQTFNKDSIQISSQRFVNDTTLVWESKKENNVETVNGYSKSGKKQYSQISVFNDKGHLISREYLDGKKSKSRSKSVLELNDDGTAKMRINYWRGKLNSCTGFEYVSF